VGEVLEHALADDEVEALTPSPARDVPLLVPVALAGVGAHVGGDVAHVLLVGREPVAPEARPRPDVEHRPQIAAEPADHPRHAAGEAGDFTLSIDARCLRLVETIEVIGAERGGRHEARLLADFRARAEAARHAAARRRRPGAWQSYCQAGSQASPGLAKASA